MPRVPRDLGLAAGGAASASLPARARLLIAAAAFGAVVAAPFTDPRMIGGDWAGILLSRCWG